MQLVLTLELDEATPSNNVIKGMHFRVYQKERRNWRGRVFEAANKAGWSGSMVERCYLHVQRYSAGAGLDWDNAYGGLKPVLDCLVSPSARNPDGIGIIKDDNPSSMPLPPFLQQFPGKRGAGRTVITVYDADAPGPPPPGWH